MQDDNPANALTNDGQSFDRWQAELFREIFGWINRAEEVELSAAEQEIGIRFSALHEYALRGTGLSLQQLNRLANFLDLPTFSTVEIPEQNANFRFGISNHQLTLEPHGRDGNDWDTIEALQQEVLSALRGMSNRYKGGNTKQAEVFAPIAQSYAEELDKNSDDIDFRILYLRGSRFYASLALADKALADGDPDWVDFEVGERSEIEFVCEAHGQILMASHVGREAVANADAFKATPETQRQQDSAFADLRDAVLSEPELFDAKAKEVVETALDNELEIGQPMHHRVVKFAVTASLLAVFIGAPVLGATYFVSGMGTPGLLVAGLVLNEAAKKTRSVGKAAEVAAKKFDNFEAISHEKAIAMTDSVIAKIRMIVENHSDAFRKIGALRPQFKWVRRFVGTEEVRTNVGRFIEVTGRYAIIAKNEKEQNEIFDLLNQFVEIRNFSVFDSIEKYEEFLLKNRKIGFQSTFIYLKKSNNMYEFITYIYTISSKIAGEFFIYYNRELQKDDPLVIFAKSHGFEWTSRGQFSKSMGR